MSIDIHKEWLLSLSQAADLLPSRPSPTTMWRWCTHGVRGIKLASIKVGRARLTSQEALQAFVDALNEPTHESRKQPADDSRNAVTERKLREKGMLGD